MYAVEMRRGSLCFLDCRAVAICGDLSAYSCGWQGMWLSSALAELCPWKWVSSGQAGSQTDALSLPQIINAWGRWRWAVSCSTGEKVTANGDCRGETTWVQGAGRCRGRREMEKEARKPKYEEEFLVCQCCVLHYECMYVHLSRFGRPCTLLSVQACFIPLMWVLPPPDPLFESITMFYMYSRKQITDFSLNMAIFIKSIYLGLSIDRLWLLISNFPTTPAFSLKHFQIFVYLKKKNQTKTGSFVLDLLITMENTHIALWTHASKRSVQGLDERAVRCISLSSAVCEFNT